jgi:membrane protein
VYFIRFVLFCTDTVNDFLSKNCPYVAGAISFYALFSFFPLVFVIVSVASFVVGPGAAQTQLAKDIAEIVPVTPEFIGETMEGVLTSRAITGAASFVGLLWAATAAFGALRKGINAAWGIKKTRPYLKERLMDFGLVLGASVLLIVLLFITPIMGLFGNLIEQREPEAGILRMLWDISAQLITPVMAFITFTILYRFLPNTKVQFGDVSLVALGAALAFSAAKWVFIWYVKRFPVYNAVYGSVGGVMALLTWVYVSAIIILFGALVTSRYAAYAARVREERGIKLIWTGLSRVRLRVVATTEAV